MGSEDIILVINISLLIFIIYKNGLSIINTKSKISPILYFFKTFF